MERVDEYMNGKAPFTFDQVVNNGTISHLSFIPNSLQNILYFTSILAQFGIQKRFAFRRTIFGLWSTT